MKTGYVASWLGKIYKTIILWEDEENWVYKIIGDERNRATYMMNKQDHSQRMHFTKEDAIQAATKELNDRKEQHIQDLQKLDEQLAKLGEEFDKLG